MSDDIAFGARGFLNEATDRIELEVRLVSRAQCVNDAVKSVVLTDGDRFSMRKVGSDVELRSISPLPGSDRRDFLVFDDAASGLSTYRISLDREPPLASVAANVVIDRSYDLEAPSNASRLFGDDSLQLSWTVAEAYPIDGDSKVPAPVRPDVIDVWTPDAVQPVAQATIDLADFSVGDGMVAIPAGLIAECLGVPGGGFDFQYALRGMDEPALTIRIPMAIRFEQDDHTCRSLPEDLIVRSGVRAIRVGSWELVPLGLTDGVRASTAVPGSR